MSTRTNWLAIGTGIGIEITPQQLRVAVTKVRPSGTEMVGTLTIDAYQGRPAAEWGNEYAALLRRHGVGHLAATVVLPRRELTVRIVTLPGVAEGDLENALRLQIDTLHPYAEADAAWTWAKLGKSGAILVAVTRQSWMERHLELLTEAGIKVSSFTFPAALLYSALRLYSTPPAEGFVGLMETGAGVEVYGESPARAVFSAVYDTSWERAAVLAAAELRLNEHFSPKELAGLLPSPRRVMAGSDDPLPVGAYLASLAAACPRMALPVNLLPASQRVTSSRWIYVPTLALGALVIAGLVALGFYGRYEDRKYLDALNAEIRSLEPRAMRVGKLDQQVEQARARIRLLDAFQGRTRQDLDALREVTKVIAPPAWLNTLELSRSSLVVAGEADQATGLLKALDNSPQFQGSEFLIPLSRVGNVEVFRIKAAREGAAQ